MTASLSHNIEVTSPSLAEQDLVVGELSLDGVHQGLLPLRTLRSVDKHQTAI